ncbi:hypothetical protein BIY24_10675 [Halobacteriovorax marinus]|uniref:hypothetical protein n=1 Tax=Halobacteriovorax marinus TaxID=97084 RepID=UPI000BC2D075|nr:hypothetical protein [Halobacteriovorax marinus]ATH08395.1 hypothetical protein BIY24_10675 [Halobacteriovorax marinus]
MKTLSLVLTLVISLFSTFVCAKEQIDQAQLEKVVHEFLLKRDFSSGLARKDKNYELLIGYGIDTRDTYYQLTLGKYINPKNILELSLNKFSDIDPDRYNTVSYKGRLMKVDLGLKSFVGNSFYLKGGLGYTKGRLERISSEWTYDSNFNYSEYLVLNINEVNALSAEADIGNQWQFESFTIGMSWIGVSSKILNFNDSEFSSSQDSINSKTSIRILNLQLGMSF